MRKKVDRQIFNVSLIKTLYYNVKYLKLIRPKLLIGRRTIVMIDKRACIEIKDRLTYGTFYTKKQKSLINIGENSILKVNRARIGNGTRITVGTNAEINIGKNVFVNENSRIMATKKITIGNDVSIGWGVNILDSDRHSIYVENILQEMSKEITIGNNVWIGFGASILKGVTISNDSIVASNAVVTKDVPPNVVVAGNPAKVIKKNVSWQK